jgi:hypothetical protein
VLPRGGFWWGEALPEKICQEKYQRENWEKFIPYLKKL